ncbi:MAG: sulfur carrier protein ThiS [Bacteroidetes bacterium]|jgi:sulfur carrier protein|nr:sulfur carrier protein ThiS [Bacteroidota bacterium]MBU1579427.1 sulfur carrier protein ThiS [Bacteroidota bacterium]MBU2466191.1 sulfur carrier protein ThiS [Bacteroidota bacterium]MBU2557755.1 sulfur carrier protein ThiS [Bacteroidota bacterium]MDA3943737.1 sulfur carrier protein ThiS [Bacteroidota bacterium]
MEIILNNRTETIAGDAMTINELINYKNFTFKMLVTKINGKLVKVDKRDDAVVRTGDNVEILHLISGG